MARRVPTLLALLAHATLLGTTIFFVASARCRTATPHGPRPAGPPPPEAVPLADAAGRLRPLHRVLGPPEPGDWLTQHHEPGQTFAEYVGEDPVVPTAARGVLYVQPLGAFTPTQRRLVGLAAEYLGLHYAVPVRVLDEVGLDVVPASARRVHPTWGDAQILTNWVLHDLLGPRLPADALAIIAFTGSDLWPGRGWNFVFGQASLEGRVGVWSLYRNGDPDAGPAEFRLCLERTLKTAAHETGHMLSIRHCTAYECAMCGSNSRTESDRRPLWFCGECEAKVWWATRAEPAPRFTRLAEWCASQGLDAAADYFRKAATAVGG